MFRVHDRPPMALCWHPCTAPCCCWRMRSTLLSCAWLHWPKGCTPCPSAIRDPQHTPGCRQCPHVETCLLRAPHHSTHSGGSAQTAGSKGHSCLGARATVELMNIRRSSVNCKTQLSWAALRGLLLRTNKREKHSARTRPQNCTGQAAVVC